MHQPTHQNALMEALKRDCAIAFAVKEEAKRICADQGYPDAAHAIQNLLAVNVCVDSVASPAQAEEADLPPDWVAVPDGYVLLPKKATPAMLLAAGYRASAVGASNTGHEMYAALIAAAPMPNKEG